MASCFGFPSLKRARGVVDLDDDDPPAQPDVVKRDGGAVEIKDDDAQVSFNKL